MILLVCMMATFCHSSCAAGGSAHDQVAAPEFSVQRGFYSTAFNVAITSKSPGAKIYYTMDCSEPGTANGMLYTNPITVTHITVLRAVGTKGHCKASNIETHTYIFLRDAIHQPQNPTGFPSTWGSCAGKLTMADYGMDPKIVDNPLYANLMSNSLLSIPSISIVTAMTNLFDPQTGIYAQPSERGHDWERPASFEWINTGGKPGFQICAGLRVHGGAGRDPLMHSKHSFKLIFKDKYGSPKLKYALFDDEGAADRLDEIVLRAGGQDKYAKDDRFDSTTTYLRDEFVRRTQLALGKPSPHGTFAHLYLNGLYWGLYNVSECVSASFAADYFGGRKGEWDVIDDQGAVKGDTNAWSALLAQMRSGMSDNATYQKIQGNNPDGTSNFEYVNLLDMENYIDFLIIELWIGNADWPEKNWYAVRRQVGNEGFKFIVWDSEVCLDRGRNRVGAHDGIAAPYAALRRNAEFRVLFADHVYKYCFNNGPLCAEAVVARYRELADKIEMAVIAETARWGNQKEGKVYTPEDWRKERDLILHEYLPNQPAIAMQWFRDAGLYPKLDTPVFNANGGTVGKGFMLSITSSTNAYYTLDGADPRERCAGRPLGILYTAPIPLSHTVVVKVRAMASTNEWSALNQAVFTVDTSSSKESAQKDRYSDSIGRHE
jgi:hypothetical protein